MICIVIVVASFSIYKMVIAPVSVTFESCPAKILTNSSSPIVVAVFPVNRLGLRIPFGHLDGKFVVNEGSEKIDIVQEKRDELIFKTGDSVGRLVIFYYTNRIPFPIQIILNIENSSLAMNNHFAHFFA